MLTPTQQEEISSYVARATPTIRYSIRRILRRDDEDLFQHTCWLICRQWESCENYPLLWASAIARNITIDYLRSKDRKPECAMGNKAYVEHSHTLSPERIYAASEELGLILAQIPETYQEYLMLPRATGVDKTPDSSTIRARRKRAVALARGIHADLR